MSRHSCRAICLIGVMLFTVILTGCGFSAEVTEEGNKDASSPSTAALEYWREQFPDNKIIIWDEEDLTANGRIDTVIVFNVGRNKNALVVVLDSPEGYRFTEVIPAPVENQTIEFKDIDEEPPIELIISGSKGTFVGYAIYRIVDGELVDLFSQDMNYCC